MIQVDNINLENRLENIEVKALPGEFVHILGANGAGKSSLLSVISGLLKGNSGGVSYLIGEESMPVEQLSLQQLALYRCFQEQQQQTQFDLTVAESLQFFTQFTTLPDLLEKGLEVAQFLPRNIQSLSGGESRRVHIARVLLQIWPKLMEGAGLVLLDEPIQGLDFKHQHLLFTLLRELASMGNTVIASHHDLNLCFRYSDKVWLMKNGRIFQAGVKHNVMTEQALSQAYDCKITQYSHQNVVIFQSYPD